MFLTHRHRDEVLSFMLHKCVVYCSVVGCQPSGRDLFFLIHRHRDEVLSFMLHCCVVCCIVVGCQSIVAVVGLGTLAGSIAFAMIGTSVISSLVAQLPV